MNEFLRFALLGMATGSLYALVALGVVLVYRASGVLNFAAGAMGALAAYVFYGMRDEHNVNWLIALVAALALGGLIGLVGQVLILRILRNASLLSKLIATLGVMVLLQGIIQVIYGTQDRGQPDSVLPTDNIKFAEGLVIGKDRLILIAMAVLLAVGLRALYSKTLFGLATSAVAENRRVAAFGGWSTTTIEVANFVIAGVLSAGAAILIAPIVSLEAGTLTVIVIPALAAALVGQFSSFAITVGAALLIGIGQSELQVYNTDIADKLGVSPASLSGLPQAVPLIAIVLVTVLSGRARPARGETFAKLPLPGDGFVSPMPLVVGIAMALWILWSATPDWADAIIITCATGILVLSVVVVTGYCGQLSLAQFALAGFGAWVAARMFERLGWSFELCLLLGVLLTVPVGLLVALPALRTRGVNLAVATLGLALMINALVFNNGSLTGGFIGTVVTNPKFFGIELDPISRPERYGTLVLIFFVLSGLVVANVRRGRSGRRLLAVRSNERAAASLGVGVYGAKLYAFGLGAGIAAVAGVFLAFRQENVQFGQFNVIGSITAVQYAVIGGVGWAAGSVVGGMFAAGALLAKVLNELTDGAEDIGAWLLIIAGAWVIQIIWQNPDGIAALNSHIFGRFLPKFPPTRLRTTDLAPEPSMHRPPCEIEVDKVTVRFGGVVALCDVGFTLRPGEVLGLIGPNGAGKTTMLDIITGFTKQTTGSVRMNGESIDGWSPERRARAGLARSWQAVELFDEMTVRDNLLVAADRKAASRYFVDLFRPGRQRPTEMMNGVVAEFNLEDFLDLRPSALSQGKQRLVGIARAMCTEPAVLFLDEPAAGLDTHESEEPGEAIRRVARDRGIGILLVEHDVPLLMATCDRIVVLDFGVKIAEGLPEEVQRDPNVIKAYLGEELEIEIPEELSVGDPA